jgi:hypothetical protein
MLAETHAQQSRRSSASCWSPPLTASAAPVSFFDRFPVFLTVFFAADAPVDGVDGVGDMMEKVKEAVEELFHKDTDVEWGSNI